MRLNIFNSWKPLGNIYGINIEYQTAKSNGNAYSTLLRSNGITIANGYGMSPETSQQSAIKTLRSYDAEEIRHAIGNKTVLRPKRPVKQQEKDVDWRDGIGHSYRAQKRLLREEELKRQKNRNFVAKNASKFNKSAIMRDRKNDYKRKNKHPNKQFEEQ